MAVQGVVGGRWPVGGPPPAPPVRPATADHVPSPPQDAPALGFLRRGAAILSRRPWLLTATLCLLAPLLGRSGADTPAQEYRVWVFRHVGPVVFDDQWYGGHHLPGYSALFPPLAAVFGLWLVGAVSCVSSTVFLTRLVRGRPRDATPRSTGGYSFGLLWFAVATVADLVIGRLPFALGLSFGILAMVGVREDRRWVTGVAAALCSLASPLAAAFLLLVGLAWAPSLPPRRTLPLLAAGSGFAFSLAFPEGGTFPFPAVTLAGVLGFAGVGLLLVPSQAVVLRRALVMYAGFSLLFFLVPSPVGGNMARLGSLVAGPVAAIVLHRRVRALAVLVVPLLVWQLGPVAGALADSRPASSSPAYYAGLLAHVRGNDAPDGRLEIPFTRDHWEASRVAPYAALARGWERQLDIQVNAPLYDPQLDAASYHQWLIDRGVRYVALPDAPLDPSATREAQILRSWPSYLTPVWSDQHWQLWEVTDAQPLTRGGDATLTRLGVASFSLLARKPGLTTVLLRYSPYWQVSVGNACVSEALDGWTLVRATTPGEIEIAAKLSVNGLLARGSSAECNPGTTVLRPGPPAYTGPRATLQR